MAKRMEWPVKNLRMDLDDGYYWLVEKTRYGVPFPAKFTADKHLAGGGRWRLPFRDGEIYASHVFEEYHYLGPLQMITYERD